MNKKKDNFVGSAYAAQPIISTILSFKLALSMVDNLGSHIGNSATITPKWYHHIILVETGLFGPYATLRLDVSDIRPLRVSNPFYLIYKDWADALAGFF